jgi:hypothetical protein
MKLDGIVEEAITEPPFKGSVSHNLLINEVSGANRASFKIQYKCETSDEMALFGVAVGKKVTVVIKRVWRYVDGVLVVRTGSIELTK